MSHEGREIESLLPKLPHKLQVSFALYCAKDVFHLVHSKDKAAAKACIDMTELWLIDKATAEEVRAVADVAYASADAAANSAAYVVYAAAYVDNAAANVYYTYYAYAAANAAVYASTNEEGKIKEYLLYLKTMIKDIGLVEKTFYRLEEV